MAKLMKLKGLKTFTAPKFGDVIVRKGEVARFDDAIGERLMESGRYNADKDFITYWEEMPEGTTVDHDFGITPVPVDDTAAPAVSPVVAAKATTVKRAQRRAA